MSATAHLALTFIAFSISLGCSESFDFPSGFELCHRSDNECIVKRANQIIHDHPHGYPEIVLPDFEPFRLSKLEVAGNPNSPINFNLEMTDLAMYGYSNMTFTKLSGFTKDPSKIKIETESYNPRVKINGKYKISGKLLVVPITGEGNTDMVIDGLKIKTRTRPTFKVIDGKTHLKMNNYKLHVTADNLKIQMTNLFNGDKVLGENMLKIMNDNWKLLWDEMSPHFTQEISNANKKIFDAMYEKIPYEDMFLPD